MPFNETSRTVRRRKVILSSAVLATAFLATGVTAVTAAGASASTHAASTNVAFKKKHKSKPKPKPKPKPTTTTTGPKPPVTDETPPSGNVTIYEEGSTLLYPLYQEWAPAYHSAYSNITIDPAGGGSGKGISDAAAGVIDIGSSDAYLSPSELTEYPGMKNIALEISAQMVNYNIPGLSSSVHLKLTGSVISQIYQGQITMWNDSAIASLNPGVVLPADKIVALHRSDSSGDTFLFSTFLSDTDPKGWGTSIGYNTSIAFPTIPNALGETGNGGMVSGCQSTPGCIAYIGISYESKTQAAGLGIAQLQNASNNYELPVASTITAEAKALEAKTPPSETLSLIYDNASDGYPIVNYEYAIIPAKEQGNQKAAAVRAFLYWAIDPNKGSSAQYLTPVNFQPLTPAVAALSDAQIAQISG
jgi:phosphate transport system substrate-binding protein